MYRDALLKTCVPQENKKNIENFFLVFIFRVDFYGHSMKMSNDKTPERKREIQLNRGIFSASISLLALQCAFLPPQNPEEILKYN